MDMLKPMLKPKSLPLTQGLQGISLTRFADELLCADADVTSEGQVDREVAGVYHGSTLIAVSLDRADLDLGPLAGRPELLLAAVRRSVLFRLRLLRIARAELERKCAPDMMGSMATHMEFRVDGSRLLVDIYVECPLAAPSAAGAEPDGGDA